MPTINIASTPALQAAAPASRNPAESSADTSFNRILKREITTSKLNQSNQTAATNSSNQQASATANEQLRKQAAASVPADSTMPATAPTTATASTSSSKKTTDTDSTEDSDPSSNTAASDSVHPLLVLFGAMSEVAKPVDPPTVASTSATPSDLRGVVSSSTAPSDLPSLASTAPTPSDLPSLASAAPTPSDPSSVASTPAMPPDPREVVSTPAMRAIPAPTIDSATTDAATDASKLAATALSASLSANTDSKKTSASAKNSPAVSNFSASLTAQDQATNAPPDITDTHSSDTSSASTQLAPALSAALGTVKAEVTPELSPAALEKPTDTPISAAAAPSATLTTLPDPSLAAATALKHVPQALGNPGWDKAIGQKVLWMVGASIHSAELSLNPPDLGPLQVVLKISNEQASASFTTAQPEVRAALEASLPKLRQMMSEAGIELSGFAVNTGSAGAGQQGNAYRAPQTPQYSGNSGKDSLPVVSGAATNVQKFSSRIGEVDTFA
ncbi:MULTISPECIES: flagellar hook-length control protein FliK [unclassified Undibacterium]|nr:MULTISPECIES: flagellar hook-length control protein FliK [unclassified Undibacterium]MEB0215828.1 flagellar hook-length control protein FliK [Undibacterium sp. 5I2]WPX42679.1 flagellar hook-length control protein FliK [Undibacterium sp. CCC3.4]